MLIVVIEGNRLPDRPRLQALARKITLVPQLRFALINAFPRGENGMMKINAARFWNWCAKHSKRPAHPLDRQSPAVRQAIGRRAAIAYCGLAVLGLPIHWARRMRRKRWLGWVRELHRRRAPRLSDPALW